MFVKFVDIDWFFLCVILTFACSLKACHMWLTKNHMFICKIWEKFISFIFWNFEVSLVSLGGFKNFKKVKSVMESQLWKYSSLLRFLTSAEKFCFRTPVAEQLFAMNLSIEHLSMTDSIKLEIINLVNCNW